MTESPLEKALNRLLWKIPKPPGCETAEDVAIWMIEELRDAGVRVTVGENEDGSAIRLLVPPPRT